MDNCWDYNDGQSEERMGKALQGGYRERAFLMTKIDGRTARAASEQLEQSRKRLRADVIDLVQIHEIIRPGDPERCFAPGGAIEALKAAQKAGQIRYIGFTGHKDPDYHLAMIEMGLAKGFTFDTVQMPLNVMDAHYDSFERRVVPVAEKGGVALLAMKPLGTARPNGWVAWSTSPHRHPPSTRTVRFSWSTRMPLSRDRSITSPPSQTPRPGPLCPPPRTARSSFAALSSGQKIGPP